MLGLACLIFASRIHEYIAQNAPIRVLFRSSGTTRGFGGWTERGTGAIVGLGIVLLVASVLSISPQRNVRLNRFALRPNQRHGLIVNIASAALVGGWFYWLATPFNAGHPHVYYHWVIQIYSDSASHFYFMPQALNRWFIWNPALLQALLWASSSFLIGASFRALGFRQSSSVMSALSVGFSAPFLYFAGAEEDVAVVTFFIALFCYVFTARSHPVLHAGAALLCLAARPSLIVIFIAILAVYAIGALLDRENVNHPWFVTFIGSYIALFFLYQLFLHFESRRWFARDGRIINIGNLEALEPVTQNGFTIYPFSGVYVGHALWQVSSVALVLTIAAMALGALHRPLPLKALVLLISGVGLVVLNEVEVLLFFDIRYLTYAIVPLTIGGWSLLAEVRQHPRFQRNERFLEVLAALSLAAFMLNPFSLKTERNERPLIEFTENAANIRDSFDNRCVIVGSEIRGGSPSIRLRQAANFVFQEPSIDGDPNALAVEQECLVIAYADEVTGLLPTSAEVVYRDQDVVIVDNS